MGYALLAIIKFIGAVLAFPVVLASGVEFYRHLSVYPNSFKDYFLSGSLAFLLVFLFIYRCWPLYELGQKINLAVFKVLAPLDKFFSYLVPVYYILVMLVFAFVSLFLQVKSGDPYFMFFSGFFLAFHIILVAQEIQEEEKSPFKPGYFLIMSLVFIFVMFIGVIAMDLVSSKMTFQSYLKDVFEMVSNIYRDVFNRLAYR